MNPDQRACPRGEGTGHIINLIFMDDKYDEPMECPVCKGSGRSAAETKEQRRLSSHKRTQTVDKLIQCETLLIVAGTIIGLSKYPKGSTLSKCQRNFQKQLNDYFAK